MIQTTTPDQSKSIGKFPNGLEFKLKTKSTNHYVIVQVQSLFLNKYWRTIDRIKSPILSNNDYAGALTLCIDKVEKKYNIKIKRHED